MEKICSLHKSGGIAAVILPSKTNTLLICCAHFLLEQMECPSVKDGQVRPACFKSKHVSGAGIACSTCAVSEWQGWVRTCSISLQDVRSAAQRVWQPTTLCRSLCQSFTLHTTI